MTIGEFLELSATNVALNPNAGDDENLISFDQLKAKVTVGGIVIGGKAEQFAIQGDGDFVGLPGFTVGLSLTNADSNTDASGLGVPSVLPIQIDNLSLTWPQGLDDPTNFRILISAGIEGSIGPMGITGSVEGLEIDVAKLRDGQFPIVALESATAEVTGTLFGADIKAEFIAGVIRFDADGQRIASGDRDTPIANSVFYAAIEGGIDIAGLGGLTIRLGLSEKGPLSAYVETSGVSINLGASGLMLTDFRGGIVFGASPLPEIEDARDLRGAAFKPQNKLTSEQWLAQIQQQVIAQAGSGGGFLFSIDAALAADLNAGSLTTAFETPFQDLGYSLPGTPTVTEVEDNERWLIQTESDLFLVERGSVDLNVSKLLLSLPNASATALNAGGTVSAGLIDAFADAGIALSDDATIAVETTGEKWRITDEGRQYVIKAKGDVLSVTAGPGALGDLEKVIRIEAGATIVPQFDPDGDLFKAEADLIVTTAGQFAINARATIASAIESTLILYCDFRGVTQGEASVSLLMELGRTSFTPPVYTVWGTVKFQETDDFFKVSFVNVGIELNAADLLTVTLTGSADLTFTDTRFTLEFAASMSFSSPFLTIEDGVSAAGVIVINNNQGTPEFSGAIQIDTSLKQLEDVGLYLEASLTLRLNTTGEEKTEILDLPGRAPETIVLPAQSFSVYADGGLTVKPGDYEFMRHARGVLTGDQQAERLAAVRRRHRAAAPCGRRRAAVAAVLRRRDADHQRRRVRSPAGDEVEG